MQEIGIDISDFKTLRVKNKYFIGKSLFIKHILDIGSKVLLITCPKRFGKTLNLSMLRYYLDCNQKCTNELFNGLKIIEQGEKYTSKLGYYPCIYITFEDVKGTNLDDMIISFQKKFAKLFGEYLYLLKSDKLLDIEEEMFSTVLNMKANQVQLQTAIKLLSRLINKELDKPVILIVDDFDVPIKEACSSGFYEETISFFSLFNVATLKITPI